MLNIDKICDYIIFRLRAEGNSDLSHLKLQKLLYYVQAWYLAFENKPLFDGKFQAWIHGPVNRKIYNRFKDTKYIYSTINTSDIIEKDIVDKLEPSVKEHVDIVLEVYAGFSDTTLELKTHCEQPWIDARSGFQSFERCEVELLEDTMRAYYKARLG